MLIFSHRLRAERGFTLIELLIVVAIIAILAAILIPNFLRARAQSQVAASKANLKNVGTALESYFVDRASYPTSMATLVPNYLRTVPRDPCTNQPYEYDPSGTPPTNYTVEIEFDGTPCHAIVDGLRYTPRGGIEELD